MYDEQQTSAELETGAIAEHDIADTARRTKLERFITQRVFEPAAGDTASLPAQRDQRNCVAGTPGNAVCTRSQESDILFTVDSSI